MGIKNKKITMAELASLADVDISTVSRALNDSPLVKAHTKKKVLEIAERTGYAINASARNLRRQSSGAIGIVIPLNPESGQTIFDPFFLEMVGAVSHALSRRNYDLILSVPREKEQIAERRLLQTGQADGLIVIGQAGRMHRLNTLNVAKGRIVVWGGRLEEQDYPVVGSDNVEGGRLAADHLLGLGRKHILFLGDIELPEVALRYQGFLKAHKALGIANDERLIVRTNFGGEAVEAGIQYIRKQGLEFDAVFASSDVLAMSAINALRNCGLLVPQDVAIVGYDNTSVAAMATPPITTIDQNIMQGGELMVDLLLQEIAGEDVQSCFTQTRLIVRNSCGS
jgi:DNA-binding LacI/PurR family transcriptional regulator